MTALIVPASFQDIGEAFEIGIDIGMGVIDRMAHPGLRRKVHDHLKAMPRKQRSHRRTIREIGLHEGEVRMPAQDLQPGLLQRRIVIGVEAVEADDVAALSQQLARDVEADKARRPRHQYCLIRHRIPSGSRRNSAAPVLHLFSRRIEGVAITRLPAYCQIGLKTIPRQRSSAHGVELRCF